MEPYFANDTVTNNPIRAGPGNEGRLVSGEDARSDSGVGTVEDPLPYNK